MEVRMPKKVKRKMKAKMIDFKMALKYFEEEQFDKLMTQKGLYFLILRSMSRTEILAKLLTDNKLNAENVPSRKLLEYVYEKGIPLPQIEKCIHETHAIERSLRKEKEDTLISELYKLNIFDWGGLHQNSLEKTIVDNYVKKITSFDLINKKIENELQISLKGYVLCSWYNHWTSIIIEDIFKDHEKVLPAVGLVKKIDFFINQIPFDLKVTYFPEGFISEKRKVADLRPETTELKKIARLLNIHFDVDLGGSDLLEDLWKKINDHPGNEAKQCISSIVKFRTTLIDQSVRNPHDLIKWLYENQGARRFDSSNRLFLILVDRSNHFDSWKLKRAKPLLTKTINGYLDALSSKDVGKVVEFDWESNRYKAISDAVFVLK